MAPRSMARPLRSAAVTPRACPLRTRVESQRDALLIAHNDAVGRLYKEQFESLLKAALRYVDRDDAADVVHEAFAELLASPSRKPTRAAAWCIVRDVARERRAEQ